MYVCRCKLLISDQVALKVISVIGDCRKVVKKVFIGNLRPDETVDAAQEAGLLRNLNHPGIVRFYDSFIDAEFFCIVTEFCDVSLLV